MNIRRPDRSELEAMSKTELIDLVEKLFDVIESLSSELKSYKDRLALLEKKVQELGNHEKHRKKKQRKADQRHWEKRLTQLHDELITEPERIRNHYQVITHRVDPVGLVYLWPVSR